MNVWNKILEEGNVFKFSSEISNFYKKYILTYSSLEEALAHYIYSKIKSSIHFENKLLEHFQESFRDPITLEIIEKDLIAIYKRDPACQKMSDVFLYYKGFHALSLYRLGRYFIKKNDLATALLLQYLGSVIFGVDINPKAKIGKGIFIDHSHSIVVEETCEISNYVSILQNVTLGGIGREKNSNRHPKIGEGVLIGAGAKIFGNIKIGNHYIIGASSVVLDNIPENSVAVGIPAKVIKKNIKPFPADELEHKF